MTKISLIIEMFQSGKSPSEIRKELGVRRSSVHLALMKAGLKSGGVSSLTNATQATVREMYTTGHSVKEIRDRLSLSRFQVEKVLGFKLRNNSESNHLIGVRKAPSINESQRQCLLGGLLGDSSISKNDNRGYYVRTSHSWKYREYARYKSRLLNSGQVHQYENNGFSDLPLATFVFKNARVSKYLESVVLVGEKKYVNKKWMDELTIEGIAYWFMDDGSSSSRKTTVIVTIHTNGFDLQENKILASKLSSLGFEAYVRRSPSTSGSGCVVSIRAKSTDAFMNAIKPYVWPVKCMRYKIKFRPAGRSHSRPNTQPSGRETA